MLLKCKFFLQKFFLFLQILPNRPRFLHPACGYAAIGSDAGQAKGRMLRGLAQADAGKIGDEEGAERIGCCGAAASMVSCLWRWNTG